MAISILLVDDHLVVLQGLRFFLETQKDFEIVGEAPNGNEATKLVDDLQPDVILMDLSMPVMDGIEATKLIKKAHPNVKIIVLTSFSDQDHVLPALRAGAEGYQLKDIEPDELVRTIHSAYQGEKLLHPKATQQLLTHVTVPDDNDGKPHVDELTPRERDVLCQITLGKSNKEISADLYITEKTVKTHVSSIFSKLGVHDRTQAAILAMKNEWFEE
ncbi:MAG TPA: response regulator transcription factor [Bacillales bacterium]|nr:response regulator transcription factor [Bacillales bacterium]